VAEINTEALAGLTAAIESLLETVVDPPVQLSLLVTPTHISPTGLGGFVGINEDPQGGILGRRLQATALVSVSEVHCWRRVSSVSGWIISVPNLLPEAGATRARSAP
jgi:hypothetical protein